MNVKIEWTKTPNGNYVTKTTDPRTGQVYYGAPLPKAFALKLGMKETN